MASRTCAAFVVASTFLGPLVGAATAADEQRPPTQRTSFVQLLEADQPVYWWRFDAPQKDDRGLPQTSGDVAPLKPKTHGKVSWNATGPQPPFFPLFAADNACATFGGNGASLRFTDPGDNSPLDFANGDAITLEAWVNITKLSDGQQVYIIGKGRTNNKGVASENQNYALRLTGSDGQACLSFLFRDADNRQGQSSDYHRWNSNTGFAVDSGWHHVAATYVFGDAKSVCGYIDGQPVTGKWDYGGPTSEPPVVDNDELWIGSSMGGNPGSSFQGDLDEIALYRTTLTAEQVAARYVAVAPPSYATPDELPREAVLVEVFEKIPDKLSMKFPVPEPSERFEWPAFALTELPQFYNRHGVRDDRATPLMVRISGYATWPAEDIQLRVRARGGAALKIDGQDVATVPFVTQGSDGHGGMYPVPGDDPDALRDVPTGDREVRATIRGTGQPQRVQFDLYVGGRKRRPELGETLIAWKAASSEGIEEVLAYGDAARLTNQGWTDFAADLGTLVAVHNRDRRETAAREWSAYWDKRHEMARQDIAHRPAVTVPALPAGYTATNEIDHFIAAGLAQEKLEPQPLADDWSFLRRATLDLIGVLPDQEMITEYFADEPAVRRSKLIDRLLAHPGWADNWMGYWQDVLAENPNVINPTLNNTGPFRFWLHESFADNKPFDRFATELILMEGSTYFGGPAGFAMASQNDAPMAAKAHILAQAFLGMEMKCARCHDAPYHDFLQKDLFSLAAMLDRKAVTVPKTSSIPGDPAALQSLLVKVTLKPGEPVPPEWPFAEYFSGELATDMLLQPDDRREELAAIITSSSNGRFGQVIVNRVWRRYLGRGIQEPVDDWESFAPSHPELLQYLEHRFIESGYDLKALARLILNSQTYQRTPDAAAATDERRARLLAGPSPRRMTAEQVVDSLFSVAAKPMNVEPMNIDVDGLREFRQSMNLGPVNRAWQLTSMSNERDRPSLSLPAAQTLVDVLEMFGWRSTRPDPITVRPQESTVLQPAILANGVLAKRITQFSDDSRFTKLTLRDQPLDALIKEFYTTILTRPPTPEELAVVREVLQDGYETRRVAGEVKPVRNPTVTSLGVAWSNHLHPEANERKQELKHLLDRGDLPTQRLQAGWRERAEDVVWSLINSPEYLVIP